MKSNKNQLTLLILSRKTFCCYNQDVPQHRFCCRYFNNLSYRCKGPAGMNRAASTEELFSRMRWVSKLRQGAGVFRCVSARSRHHSAAPMLEENNGARTSGVRVSRHSGYTGLKMLLNAKLCSVLHVCVNHAWSRSRRGPASLGMWARLLEGVSCWVRVDFTDESFNNSADFPFFSFLLLLILTRCFVTHLQSTPLLTSANHIFTPG